MQIRLLLISATLVFVLVLGLAVMAQAADPHDGTWKLNLAKSKYNSGSIPKSLTTKRETEGNTVKTVFDGVDAEGKTIHYRYDAKLDGKDYPVIGYPAIDTISLKKTDADTYEWVTKKAGKVVTTGKTVYSKDGKTRTQTEKGKDANGKDYVNTVVYER